MSAQPTDPADAGGSLLGAVVAASAGGVVGTALRLGLGEVLALEWAVLVANLAGAFALGLLFARLRHHRLQRSATWNALGPGLLGALTTFSALQMEVVEQLTAGYPLHGLGYLAVSIGLGVPLAAAGRRLGELGS